MGLTVIQIPVDYSYRILLIGELFRSSEGFFINNNTSPKENLRLRRNPLAQTGAWAGVVNVYCSAIS